MASIFKGLIEYIGIADYLPPHTYSFKQITLQETLTLPKTKPNIKQLIKVVAETDTLKTRVVKTPKATSLEGKTLTGWSLIVESQLKLKVEYIADLESHPVHIVCFDIPFSTSIVLPEFFKTSNTVKVTEYIENLFVKQHSERGFHQNAILFLNAVIYRY
jgi:spore morphogenesis protein SipL